MSVIIYNYIIFFIFSSIFKFLRIELIKCGLSKVSTIYGLIIFKVFLLDLRVLIKVYMYYIILLEDYFSII